MSDQEQASKWQKVADLIGQLGLLSKEPRQLLTDCVDRMTTHQLLQDPVHAAIYYRGWDDRTTDIQQMLRTQPSTRPLQPHPPKPVNQPIQTVTSVTPREPTTVFGLSGTAPPPMVRKKMKAQLARQKRRFQQIKKKINARMLITSQQSQLAKLPKPT
ncbi:uncharacterized protein LOC132926712 [Rhopalosiphum padi]|uniref:uncharacterized protein LOC132926712 n=2 Tax=Rhopalosiphum padi TaxID=40932 RepID=UPI00298E4B77|nr:uncharacterized protein LOC132926712 [Rhopalosiphum padi]